MSDHHDQAAARPGDAGTSGNTDTPGLDALVERIVDLAVYAPVGVAVTLRDELPRHIKQGRQALENRLQLARFIGQLAVQTRQRELQKRIEQQRAARDAANAVPDEGNGAADVEPDPRADTAVGRVESDHVGSTTDSPVENSPVENSPVEDSPVEDSPVEDVPVATDVPAASDLPISDYESLPAINVVDRLRSMSADEIDLVRRFEQAHRARRTILAKIDQLQERQAGD